MEQGVLGRREKGGLQVIDDYRAVLKQFLGLGGEAGFQLIRISGVQPHEHGLIVIADILSGPARQRIGVLALAPLELEFRLLARHTDQAHEIDLFILGHGALEKLIFPVGSTREIQHAVRTAAAVDDHHALVIGLSGFGRIAFSRHVQAVKQNAFDRRSHFEAEG